MDVQAEKVIERYAQELARVQNELFITQAALAAYQDNEAKQEVTVESAN